MVCVNDVIDLIRRKCPWYDEYSDSDIIDIINDHIAFKTISIRLDNDKVIGVMRVNISFNIADICDLVVEDGYKTIDIIREMTLELWKNFPHVKYFKYYRISKYPLKKGKIYSIKRLMKVK